MPPSSLTPEPRNTAPDSLNLAVAEAQTVPGALLALIERTEKLAQFAASQGCMHEETYRGGAIWEICRDCGAKWADDEGGRPEWEEPAAITAAWRAIEAARSALNGAADTTSPTPVVAELVAALTALRDEHLYRYCRTKKDGVSDLPPVIQRANDAIHKATGAKK
jgi:hypothetical protein